MKKTRIIRFGVYTIEEYIEKEGGRLVPVESLNFGMGSVVKESDDAEAKLNHILKTIDDYKKLIIHEASGAARDEQKCQ